TAGSLPRRESRSSPATLRGCLGHGSLRAHHRGRRHYNGFSDRQQGADQSNVRLHRFFCLHLGSGRVDRYRRDFPSTRSRQEHEYDRSDELDCKLGLGKSSLLIFPLSQIRPSSSLSSLSNLFVYLEFLLLKPFSIYAS